MPHFASPVMFSGATPPRIEQHERHDTIGPVDGKVERDPAAERVAGVRAVRFHDLQHVGNTLASDTGANLRQLMARMGHATPQAALIYQHAAAERDRAIADTLGQMIEATLAATPDGDEQADEDETA
jgi:hypothetical protein